MKLGSHFDGIAGFPLAGMINGIEPVWATEIEPFPIKVSKTHFPGMKHYGSITDISGAELEPVDIITFGSPCQDLSVAGKRAGLEGERSGLFMEAVRTIREMREATNGLYPRFAVWENVPGALSSAGGADFRAVLEELCEAEIPIPRSGKWSNAGMVRGNGREVAWRIIDAQYWGVPQRRRRIFLIADFTGQRAAKILFERQGLPGDFEKGGGAWEETPGSAGSGTEIAGGKPVTSTITSAYGTKWNGNSGADTGDHFVLDKPPAALEPSRKVFSNGGYSNYKEDSVAATQRTCVAKQSDVDLVMQPVAFQPGNLARKAGAEPSDKCFPTLGSTTLGDQFPHVVLPSYAFQPEQGAAARSIGFHEECSPTLKAEGATPAGLIPMAFTQNQREEVRDLGDKAGSLAAEPGMHQRTYVIQNATRGKSQNGLGVSDKDVSYTLDQLGNHAVAFGGSSFGQYVEGKVSTLKSSGGDLGGGSETFVKQGYAVRRLTPGECEKLQGFPPNWTDIPGASDTARYKALGNSVAIPCVMWLMERIADIERANTCTKAI